MTTSPKGHPFEKIVFDVGQMNTLHGRLQDANDSLDLMKVALDNVHLNLEGTGRTVERAKADAGAVSGAVTVPRERIRRLAGILLEYGQGAETHGARANLLMDDVKTAKRSLTSAGSALSDAQANLDSWTRSDKYRDWKAGGSGNSVLLSPGMTDVFVREGLSDAQTAHALADEALADAWTAWEREFEAWDDAYAKAVAGVLALNGGYASVTDAATLAHLADAKTPQEVAALWAALSDAERERLRQSVPGFIGNLNGVPYADRNLANRFWLDEQLVQAKVLEDQERIDALTNIQKALDGARSEAPRSLIGLTDDSPPLAQIAIGDLDSAAQVTYAIPGMNTYTTDATGWASASQNIFDEQYRVSGAPRGSGQFAVVAWIGYETPPIPAPPFSAFNPGVIRGEYAQAGAERLEHDLAGFTALRPGAVLDVVAHSYGTTTAANALAAQDFGVDSFVMVGSAGIENAIADTARLNADHVYAGQAPDTVPWFSGDPWAWTGRVGSGRQDPIAPGFGAEVFGADGEPEPVDGELLKPTTAHDVIAGTQSDGNYGYLEPKSESLYNVARATTGRPDLMTADQSHLPAPTPGPSPTP